jgi:ADP-heptose:LPS heptosyltransferase
VIEQVERRAEEVRTPGRPWDNVRRLAIVRADRLGDFIVTLPAIDALRRTYPASAIALVVAPAVRPIAERVPGVERVHAVTGGAGALAAWLERFAPDLVVCISRAPGPAWAAWRARVPYRVGTGRRAWSLLFGRRVVEPRRAGARHEVEYALSFAHRAGAIGAPARFALDADPAARAKVDEWLARAGVGPRFVVLVPGSGGSCPRWPGRHHARLADLLLEAGVPVVVSAGPQDDLALEELQAERATRDLPLFRLGPLELVALVERAALVVGSSTAPIHVAAARGTPALALHACSSSCGPSRWGPYHERGFAIVSAPPDLAAISPEVVARAAQAILEGRRPDQPPHGA